MAFRLRLRLRLQRGRRLPPRHRQLLVHLCRRRLPLAPLALQLRLDRQQPRQLRPGRGEGGLGLLVQPPLLGHLVLQLACGKG